MVDSTVRRLPNAARAVVETRRLREDLLNLQHASGGPKARCFIGHGFASDAWVLLQTSLRAQGCARPAAQLSRAASRAASQQGGTAPFVQVTTEPCGTTTVVCVGGAESLL